MEIKKLIKEGLKARFIPKDKNDIKGSWLGYTGALILALARVIAVR